MQHSLGVLHFVVFIYSARYDAFKNNNIFLTDVRSTKDLDPPRGGWRGRDTLVSCNEGYWSSLQGTPDSIAHVPLHMRLVCDWTRVAHVLQYEVALVRVASTATSRAGSHRTG